MLLRWGKKRKASLSPPCPETTLVKTSQGRKQRSPVFICESDCWSFPCRYRWPGKHITDRTRNSPGVSTSSPPGCHQPRVSDTLIGLLLFLQLSQGVSQIALKPQTKANGRGTEGGGEGHRSLFWPSCSSHSLLVSWPRRQEQAPNRRSLLPAWSANPCGLGAPPAGSGC